MFSRTWLFFVGFCCLMLVPAAFGQLDSNSVTVTALRNANLQADQVVFAIVVTSDVNSTLSDVLTALQPAGLTLANLSGVSSVNVLNVNGALSQNNTSLQWQFILPVPLASIKMTVASLTNLQTSVPKANKNLGVSFAIQGTQVSQQLQQSQTCDVAGLIGDARTQAQTLASAGGRVVGGILAISGSTSNTLNASTAVSYGSVAPQNCSVMVKFALLGF